MRVAHQRLGTAMFTQEAIAGYLEPCSAETRDPRGSTLTDLTPGPEWAPLQEGRGRRNLFHSADDAAASPSPPPGNTNLDNLGHKLPSRTELNGLPHLPTPKRPSEASKTAVSTGTTCCSWSRPSFRLSLLYIPLYIVNPRDRMLLVTCFYIRRCFAFFSLSHKSYTACLNTN